MTDLEITKLCAEAMGLDKFQWQTGGIVTASHLPILTLDGRIDYDPLNDDAQAMALAKRFGLLLDPQQDGQDFAIDPGWEVSHVSLPRTLFIYSDLNRAICECVAHMQAAK